MNLKRFFKGKWRLFSYPTVSLVGLIFFPITICLLIIWFSNKKIGNKYIKYPLVGILSLIGLFFGAAYIAAFTSPLPGDEVIEEISEDNSLAPEVIETPAPTPRTAPNNPNILLFEVSRVIDGDTIEIEGGQRVRYIGIDTPELGDNPDCYGQESFEKNKELVENGIVGLEKDVSETDRYGRLLRYVYMGDLLINDVLVRQGYANASSYPPDVKYQSQFTDAQIEARDNNRGLWSSCVSQQTPQPTAKPVATIAPTTPPQPVSNSGSCQYSCSGPDKDCSDFSTHAQAQTFFECCGFTASYDPMRLDSVKEGDGIACESLP